MLCQKAVQKDSLGISNDRPAETWLISGRRDYTLTSGYVSAKEK